jgi:hypothetical protein
MSDSPTAPAPRPGLAHQRLEPFVGTWQTQGKVHDAGTGGRFTAQDVYEWLPGGFFFLHRWDAEMPDGLTQGIEIIGYDAESQTYFLHSYDSSGATGVMRATEADGVWSFAGDMARFTGQFHDAGTVFFGSWGLRPSETGVWRPWMDVRLSGVPVVGPSEVDGLFHLLEQQWLGERSATTAKREEIDHATIAEVERPAPK